MNCIIVDDEKVSRLIIEQRIEKVDFLNLKATFDNAADAVTYIKNEENIDLILLDIEMPNMTGVEFIEVAENLPQIIIISGEQKYALQAIEYSVTDYIVKPVSQARFIKAVNKAYKKHTDEQADGSSQKGVFIKSSSSAFIRLLYDDILWIEAMENYVVVNTFDEKYTIHFTMKSILEKLPENSFKRIHRSYIVNVEKILMIADNMVVFKTSKEKKKLSIAKSYKEKLMNEINIVSK